MNDNITQRQPAGYLQIQNATQNMGFTMASDIRTCALLKTLAASKPSGKFLELGTGTGLATSWILDGMDSASSFISVDNDQNLLAVADEFLSADKRLELVCTDGEAWIRSNAGKKFDFIFADTWHGKYLLLDETLEMLNKGGLYVIDDMTPQSNWPEGHQEKATRLLDYLDSRTDITLTRQLWASGIVIAVKR
jgi:predicted O-methyltransferase YrrM